MASGLRRYETSFVGRERDLAALRALTTERGSRAAVVGPGGVGKTRLAIELALGRVKGGAAPIFVDSASAVGAEDVALACAAGLELSAHGGAVERTLERVARAIDASRAPTWILDNCEQLDAGGQAAVARLVSNVRVSPLVMTSRTTAGLPPAEVLPLTALRQDAYEEPSPAFRLLAERARVPAAEWWASPEHRRAVQEIVRRLDGLPLAIELAAWRLRTFSPRALQDRLDDVLAMLVRPDDEPGDCGEVGATRHRSLEAVLEGSWRTLGPDERLAVQVLAALPSGASLDLFEGLAAIDGPLAVLDRLVQQSLVQQTPGEDGVPRFTLYETVRAYARAQRATDQPSLDPVWRHYVHRAAGALDAQEQDPGGELLRQLIDDRANLRAALAALGDGPETTPLLLALSETFVQTGFPAGWPAHVTRAAERSNDVPAAERARLVRACSTVLQHAGDYEASLAWAERAAKEATTDDARARAQLALSVATMRAGRLEAAERALDLAEQHPLGDRFMADLLRQRANVLVRGARAAEAIPIADRAVRLAARAGSVLAEGQGELFLGWVLLEVGTPEEAIRHLRRAVELCDAARDNGAAAYSVVLVAVATLRAGDVGGAVRTFDEGIVRAQRWGHMRAEAIGLACRGILRHLSGSIGDAERDYRDALRFGLIASDAWLAPLVLVSYGAASAELGDFELARVRFEEADLALDALPGSSRLRHHAGAMMDAARAILAVARASRGAGELEAALAIGKTSLGRVETICAAEAPPQELRVVRTLLARAIDAAEGPSAALLVGPNGIWFEAGGGGRVDLAAKPVLARILLVLTQAHVRGQREPIGRDELTARLWPDDRSERASLLNRLAVNVSKLRSLGLKDQIELSRDGIRIAPALHARIQGER